MKKALLVMLVLVLAVGLYAESNWQVIQQPTQPLIYSRSNYYFLDQNEGWLIGTISDQAVVLHTNDGGSTWEVRMQNDTLGLSFNGVSFIDSNTGWMVGEDGVIWKTEDGGADWTEQRAADAAQMTLQAVFAVDENTVYAAGEDSTILKTSNGGTDWNIILQETDPASKTPDFAAIYAFDADNAVFMSTSNDGGMVFKTTDGGQSFESQPLPFPPGISSRLYAINGTPDGVLYAGGYTGNVFKSTDYGQNWTYLATLYQTDIYQRVTSVSVIDADNAWFAGTRGRTFYTGDGGATWDTLYTPTSNNIDYIKASTADNILAAAGYAEIYGSQDGGQTFTPKVEWPNLSLYTIATAPNNEVFVGSIAGGEVSRSLDGGLTWTYPKRLSDTGDDIFDIKFIDGNVGFAVGRDGQIAKTTDTGATWIYKDNPYFYLDSRKSYYCVDFYDAMNGIAAGSSGIVMLTTDGGETWTEYSAGTSSTIYDVEYLDANTIIAAASSGKMLKSTDGGQNWEEKVDVGSNTMRSIAFVDGTTGFICASSGALFKTTDAGDTLVLDTTLVNINGEKAIDSDLYSIKFVSPTHGFICGNKGSIYETTDGGDTWNQLAVPEEIKNWTLQGMAWADENTGYICSTDGYILGYGVETGIESKPAVVKGFALDQNYPNPFNPTTSISFTLPAAEKVQLVVYNTLGQKVRTLVSGSVAGGTHTVNWDGRNEFGLMSPSGIYFYKLNAGSYNMVKKMTLLK